MKRCGDCKRMKPLDQFGRNAARKDGKHYYCRTCTAERSRAWRKGNPEKFREQKRRWSATRTPEHRRMEREKNLEVTRARNREYERTHRAGANERAKRWRQAHPEEVRERVALWHTRRKGAFIEHVLPLVVLERADGVCGVCGEDVDPASFDIDHIVPLSLGGLHNYENTQPAHPICNRRKGAQILVA